MNYRQMTVIVLALAALSCSQPAPPQNPGIENSDLGIKLTSVPEGLAVAANQGGKLELKPTDESTVGSIWFVAGPETESVNLVAAVQDGIGYGRALDTYPTHHRAVVGRVRRVHHQR